MLAGYRRTAGGRGRGQTHPFVAADLAAVLATCHRPRCRGRGVESDEGRPRSAAVLLFIAGLRRSEVSALLWGDVAEAAASDGVLVTVRRGNNEPGGRVAGRAVREERRRWRRPGPLRVVANPEPENRVVPLSPEMVGLRFQASARSAGVEARVPAHSAHVRLASELTRRGAPTSDVMLAGNWKTSR